MLYSLLVFALLLAQQNSSQNEVSDLREFFEDFDPNEYIKGNSKWGNTIDWNNIDLNKPIPPERFYYADDVLFLYKGSKWTYSDIITESAYNAGYGTTRWDKYFPYESGMDLEEARANARRAFYKRVRNTTLIIVFSICVLDLLVVFSVFQIKKIRHRRKSRKNYIRRSIGFKTKSDTPN